MYIFFPDHETLVFYLWTYIYIYIILTELKILHTMDFITMKFNVVLVFIYFNSFVSFLGLVIFIALLFILNLH